MLLLFEEHTQSIHGEIRQARRDIIEYDFDG